VPEVDSTVAGLAVLAVATATSSADALDEYTTSTDLTALIYVTWFAADVLSWTYGDLGTAFLFPAALRPLTVKTDPASDNNLLLI
jgi:hypothetical protein